MCLIRRSRESSESENGSAIAEFVFISALISLLCAAIFQLAFALHVRNTLIDSAGEGARYAALHGSSLDAGITRTRTLVNAALPSSYSEHVTASIAHIDGVPIVEVNVRSPIPLVGFLGPATVTSTGRAVVE